MASLLSPASSCRALLNMLLASFALAVSLEIGFASHWVWGQWSDLGDSALLKDAEIMWVHREEEDLFF